MKEIFDFSYGGIFMTKLKRVLIILVAVAIVSLETFNSLKASSAVSANAISQVEQQSNLTNKQFASLVYLVANQADNPTLATATGLNYQENFGNYQLWLGNSTSSLGINVNNQNVTVTLERVDSDGNNLKTVKTYKLSSLLNHYQTKQQKSFLINFANNVNQ